MYLLSVVPLLFVIGLRFYAVFYQRSQKKKLSVQTAEIKNMRKNCRQLLKEKKNYEIKFQKYQNKTKSLELLLQDLRARLASR
ncbi:MAG: hypothetical protein ACO36I_06635 [Candidatus Latescibacterota bacterium]|jgi:uncharacterized protein YlxW (UPF0749 family)